MYLYIYTFACAYIYIYNIYIYIYICTACTYIYDISRIYMYIYHSYLIIPPDDSRSLDNCPPQLPRRPNLGHDGQDIAGWAEGPKVHCLEKANRGGRQTKTKARDHDKSTCHFRGGWELPSVPLKHFAVFFISFSSPKIWDVPAMKKNAKKPPKSQPEL